MDVWAQDPVGAAREALTALASTVLRVRNEYGDTLGVRGLTSDVDRLADLEELGEPAPGTGPGVPVEEVLRYRTAPTTKACGWTPSPRPSTPSEE